MHPKEIVLDQEMMNAEKAERKISVAHFCQLAPGASGMYECVKDMIKYERKAGLESEIIDPYHELPDSDFRDGWLVPKPWKWASKANMWILHRRIPEPLDKVRKNHRTIAILHGPAMQMLISEFKSDGASASFNNNINMVWNYDRAIALSPDDYEIMRMYDVNQKLLYVQDAIDLERYPLEGMKWEYKNRPAIVITDTVRDTKIPAHIIWAMPKVTERIPDARLNILSFPRILSTMYRNILVRSKTQMLSSLTETIIHQGISEVAPFIRGADIGFINEINGRAGRTVPEKMALGIPCVSYDGDYTKYHARAWNLDSIADAVEKCWNDLQNDKEKLKNECRRYAEENFNMKKAINDNYIPLYEEILDEK